MVKALGANFKLHTSSYCVDAVAHMVKASCSKYYIDIVPMSRYLAVADVCHKEVLLGKVSTARQRSPLKFSNPLQTHYKHEIILLVYYYQVQQTNKILFIVAY